MTGPGDLAPGVPRLVDLTALPAEADATLAARAIDAALMGGGAGAQPFADELARVGVVGVGTSSGWFELRLAHQGWALVAVPWRLDERDLTDLAAALYASRG